MSKNGEKVIIPNVSCYWTSSPHAYGIDAFVWDKDTYSGYIAKRSHKHYIRPVCEK